LKSAKRILLIVLSFIVLSFLFRGWLYRHIVTYKAIDQRSTYALKSPELDKLIQDNANISSKDPEAIIERSLSLTSDILKFKRSKNDVDPNKLIETRNAHCIGYAAFFTTVCNQMFALNDLDGEWIVSPQKGHLYFMGINIHPYFKSSFLRDHDFVIIKNLKSGKEMAVDPSLHDYTGIRYVALRN
jgi:hypothetical protein